MTWFDPLRVLAIVLTIICMWGIVDPIMASSPKNTRRAWLLMASLWTFMGVTALEAAARLGEPGMSPWFTPPAVVGGILGVVYIVIYKRDARRGRALVASVSADVQQELKQQEA